MLKNFRKLINYSAICLYLSFSSMPLSASTRITLEKAQQMYQENPSEENWDQLLALQSQAKFNEAYPYLLVGLIIIYVAMRMIFSKKISKS